MTKPTKWVCAQRNSDQQSLRCALNVYPPSLCAHSFLGGCPGWTESSLSAHLFCHVWLKCPCCLKGGGYLYSDYRVWDSWLAKQKSGSNCPFFSRSHKNYAHYFLMKNCRKNYPLIIIKYAPLEPPHDRTNKMTLRQAKTQISLGIRPVWSEFSLSAWRKLSSLATHWAHSEDWSDPADAQADLRAFAGCTVILLVLSWGGSVICVWHHQGFQDICHTVFCL